MKQRRESIESINFNPIAVSCSSSATLLILDLVFNIHAHDIERDKVDYDENIVFGVEDSTTFV